MFAAKFAKKRNLLVSVIMGGVLLAVGLIAAVFLVSKSQDLRQQASVGCWPYCTVTPTSVSTLTPVPTSTISTCSTGQLTCQGETAKVCVNGSWITNRVCPNGCANGACLPAPTSTPTSGPDYHQIIDCAKKGWNWNGTNCVAPTQAPTQAPQPACPENYTVAKNEYGVNYCKETSIKTGKSSDGTLCWNDSECNSGKCQDRGFGIKACSPPVIVSPSPTFVAGSTKKSKGTNCSSDAECGSGKCASSWTSTDGSTTFSTRGNVCTYDQAEQDAFLNAQATRETQTVDGVTQGAVTYVGAANLVKIASNVYAFNAAAGGGWATLPTATYVYGQTALTTGFASLPATAQTAIGVGSSTLTIGGTLVTGLQCAHEGPNSPACAGLIGGYYANPLVFEQSLRDSGQMLLNSGKNTYLQQVLDQQARTSYGVNGKKPAPGEFAWVKNMYGVDVEISNMPYSGPNIDNGPGYVAGTAPIGGRRVTLYPYQTQSGEIIFESDTHIVLHEVGHAIAADGQVPAKNMLDFFTNECINCRWTVNELSRRGYAPNSQEVLSQLNYMHENSRAASRAIANFQGLRTNSGSPITGPQLANIYDSVISNPDNLQYVKVYDEDFLLNLQKIVESLYPQFKN